MIDRPPTRDAALARLQAFLPRAGARYAAERNEDAGPAARDNVSGLSPYLRYRLLTEAEVVAAVRQQHGLEASAKFIQEVCWRSYWKGWLEMRPVIWSRYLAECNDWHARLEDDAALRQRYQAAIDGRSGIDGFDAWARELVTTGDLHNHARMWFASIWIFTLRLPWPLGASFFQRHLVDADAASNTLSWRWVAGLHTRGKHYLARADNIRRYSLGRYHPAGQLDETAEPLPADDIPAPRPLMPPSAPPRDGRPWVWLLTEDDLGVDTLPRGVGRPDCVVGVSVRGDNVAVAPAAAAFARGALDDALNRAAALTGAPALRLTSTAPTQTIADVMADRGVAQIVLAAPPVGVVRDTLQAPLDALQQQGVAVARLRRDWDAAFWPLAAKGYFQLRQRIPEVLRQLGLS